MSVTASRCYSALNECIDDNVLFDAPQEVAGAKRVYLDVSCLATDGDWYPTFKMALNVSAPTEKSFQNN